MREVRTEVRAAAIAFDTRHSERLNVAVRRQRECARHESIANATAFKWSVQSVRANRLVVIERSPQAQARRASPRQLARAAAPPFDLMASIWAPRATWSEAKSLVDTDEVVRARFEHDCRKLLDLGLVKLVTRNDDDGATDADGDGVPDEVDEALDVLRGATRPLYLLFTFYACLGNDMHALSLNMWTQLINDCGLTSNKSASQKKSDFDRLFITVDAAATRLVREGIWKAGHQATRKKISRAPTFSNLL